MTFSESPVDPYCGLRFRRTSWTVAPRQSGVNPSTENMSARTTWGAAATASQQLCGNNKKLGTPGTVTLGAMGGLDSRNWLLQSHLLAVDLLGGGGRATSVRHTCAIYPPAVSNRIAVRAQRQRSQQGCEMDVKTSTSSISTTFIPTVWVTCRWADPLHLHRACRSPGPDQPEEVISQLYSFSSPPPFRHPISQRARANSDPAVPAVRYSIQFITDSISRSLRLQERADRAKQNLLNSWNR
ncbi:uncharacterized protein EV420DRAFT_1485742 [Desarmillaria tabescens]|uniref:Uncharacterized protein n=1 Tax=Armillaria tabescens TaxID=1929756 RepID=A0AA39JEK3_ARMTA|nr:uncharacterized protein EV420DRAFT_1485742 [Desarmillaria tabescens]KAK0441173.1 hypothetical protein EV420DRAFT_1485742 [Desarmillaria tabescens]